ncbi:hypothetical protein ACKKBF_B35095 [Auxenochlorella protothecoides x Auxenochlorella symbiontica]
MAHKPSAAADLKKPVPAELEGLAQPHIDSFDFFLGQGLENVVEGVASVEVEHPITKHRHSFWLENAVIGRPTKDDASSGADRRLFPRECRETGSTYRAPLSVDVVWQAEGLMQTQRVTRKLGQIPIMVKSRACYLRHLRQDELVEQKEEANEFGGYFICNGNERIIRMLVQNRRHYIFALRHSAFHKRGPSFTDMATLLRCVRPDESSLTNRCHLLTDGTAVFAITLRRAEFFIPAGILLKCFLDVSDKELFDMLVLGAAKDGGHSSFVADRAELVLHQSTRFGLHTRAQCLEYLGGLFRVALSVPARKTDYQVGELLLRENLFIHVEHPADKLQLGLQMLLKLYALANRQCCEDNPDAPTHHELLLPGHLLLKFMKDQLENCLDAATAQMKRDLEKAPELVNLTDEQYVQKACEKMFDVGQKVEYLLNTGNLLSKSGLDLSQATGFTVLAEKLNFHRYISHFRSVHRGAYFAELRTTTVRKLLPESWGFLCPVHTPDGSPCGLLNHLTADCRVVAREPDNPEEIERALTLVLCSLGMKTRSSAFAAPPTASLLVMLDGKILGNIDRSYAAAVVSHLRSVKAAKLALEENLTPGAKTSQLSDVESVLPSNTEIVFIPYERGAPYPGIYIYTQAARMVRPVRQILSGAAELIGSLEQCHMSIRCPDGGPGGSKRLKFTHTEFSPYAMLSVVASLTPYSDFNQSPRNMYQCQMAKQTMGFPIHATEHRADNKTYRLHTPQTPLARTRRYSKYHMDEYPNGTNAVVAVLAYTGYDMEDAMILNKSSIERGFAHASIYKSINVNLRDERGRDLKFEANTSAKRRDGTVRPKGAFGEEYPQAIPSHATFASTKDQGVSVVGTHADALLIDSDGLPHVGCPIWPGQPYYNAKETLTGSNKAGKLKGEETAIIEQVTVIGGGKGADIKQASIKMRFNRNPVIGDKFSSRHGQKGVLSRKLDDVDMPFCERTGIRPDLIINPHAFPSRMTIGMLIESLTSKAGAVCGEFVDATPFKSSEGDSSSVWEGYGKKLEAAGFTKNGGETMISGITGQAFDVDIYIGLVYYQRLRHMVSDKFQVRSTGPINPLTKQPIKGRKFGGGIRFGEMERDSLLAHGAAYLLHDRLHSCSDYSVCDVCTNCGLTFSTMAVPLAASEASGVRATADISRSSVTCRVCETSKFIERVAVPYVFRYLMAELCSMNIKCSLNVQCL